MELNSKQLENLKALLNCWEFIRGELDRMTDLAFALSMTGLGEELKWSQEKIKKFLPIELTDKEV